MCAHANQPPCRTREQKRSCREFFKSITDRVPGLFNYLTNPDRAVKDIEGAISLVRFLLITSAAQLTRSMLGMAVHTELPH